MLSISTNSRKWFLMEKVLLRAEISFYLKIAHEGYPITSFLKPHTVCVAYHPFDVFGIWNTKHNVQQIEGFELFFFWRLSQLKWMSTILLGSVGSGIKNIIFKGIIISSICCFHARLHYTCIQMGTILIQHNEERHFDYVMSQTKRLWRTPQVTGCRHYSSAWRSYKVLLKLNCGFLCFPSLFCYPLW